MQSALKIVLEIVGDNHLLFGTRQGISRRIKENLDIDLTDLVYLIYASDA